MKENPNNIIAKKRAGSSRFPPIWDKDYAKIQIITVEDLFNGKRVDMPLQHQTSITFNKAEKIKKKEGEQGRLE